MAGGKAEQFKYNIEIRKHHLTICNYSGVLTSQSSQCHQISCFSSWMSYLATNFRSGHIIIRLNIQGSCQIPNSTWSQNRPRIVLPLTLNLFLFFLSALFTKASFRILGHWNYICSPNALQGGHWLLAGGLLRFDTWFCLALQYVRLRLPGMASWNSCKTSSFFKPGGLFFSNWEISQHIYGWNDAGDTICEFGMIQRYGQSSSWYCVLLPNDASFDQ